MNSTFANTLRKNSPEPYAAFLFEFQIGSNTVGGFTELSGLDAEVQVERRRQGGVNDIEYAFPTFTKTTDLTLKRGVFDVDPVWTWFQEVADGIITRRECSIILFRLDNNKKSKKARVWNITRAFPIKWQGPRLEAQTSTFALETFTLTYEKVYVKEL